MGRLEEAIRRYKKGDSVKSTYGTKGIIDGNIHYWGGRNVFATGSCGEDMCLYDKDKDEWARVISRAEFQQDDIEAGMKVMLRNGDYCLAVSFEDEIAFVDKDSNVRLSQYKNFSTILNVTKFDIVKVIKPLKITHHQFNRLSEGEVVWEEKEEIPEYTVEELQDKLGIKFKIKGNN